MPQTATEPVVYENGDGSHDVVDDVRPPGHNAAIDYSEVDNQAAVNDEEGAMGMAEADMASQNGMSEANMAAMTLTHQENLDPHMNGISGVESGNNIALQQGIVKTEEIGEALNYSNEGTVYTELGGPTDSDRPHQLVTIDPRYLSPSVTEHASDKETGSSVLSAALRSGYTVQNMTHLTPTSHVTAIGGFDNAGHLLPPSDVEAFFSDMERPMATSVSLSGMYTAGTGQFTTLTNPPGLSLAQTYQAGTESSRLTLQPPSYSETHGDYGLTQLYSRSGAVPNQYLSNDGSSSSSPTPQANTSWGVTQDSMYVATTSGVQSLGNQGLKYSYSTVNDNVASRDATLQDSQLNSQYSRTSGLLSASSYTTYLAQDLNQGSTGWYQNVSSPFSDVRPTGEFPFLSLSFHCFFLFVVIKEHSSTNRK